MHLPSKKLFCESCFVLGSNCEQLGVNATQLHLCQSPESCRITAKIKPVVLSWEQFALQITFEYVWRQF